ncbi:MAG: hypothetical protein AAGF25_10240 [Pseudomonadota bacterium]
MGELQMNSVLAGMAGKSRLAADDVLVLRREAFADGKIDRAEAEALFAIDYSVKEKSAEWSEFFVEAVTDYLVFSEAPEGHISKDNANWLIRAISHDGVVDNATEFEVLMRGMEKSDSMPAALSGFALRQVQNTVVDGEGPLAGDRSVAKGVVTAGDVKLLRRVLYSYSSDGGLGISRPEAEVLFDINDQTAEAQNDPAWTDLFSKAIAFSLMASVSHVANDREEALRREQWLDDTSVDVTGFMAGIFSGGLKSYFKMLKSDTSVEAAYRARNEAFEAANAESEVIDAVEAEWLVERIGRDGVLHANELALIEFLKKESPDVHPSLKPLFDKVA